MSQHLSFPSIEQFRNSVRRVSDHAQYTGRDANDDPIYDRTVLPPTLTFQATTKLHGTNFAMARNKATGETWFQSRETIITPEKDNAGAARFFSDKNLDALFNAVDGNIVYIYGEWCGKGIQSKVAITNLPKMLVIFDAYALDDDRWLTSDEVSRLKDHSIQVYNIYDYPVWELTIDFTRPEESQNKLVEITTAIADQCPVAKQFGVEGLGEGAVWRCISSGYEDPKFRFKVKDERHASGSKPKVLSEVDTDAVAKVRALAEQVTPVWRLDQMLEKVCDLNNGGFIEMKKIPAFMKEVADDINKEDSDIIKEAGLTYNDIARYVANIARLYFMNREKGIIDKI